VPFLSCFSYRAFPIACTITVYYIPLCLEAFLVVIAIKHISDVYTVYVLAIKYFGIKYIVMSCLSTAYTNVLIL